MSRKAFCAYNNPVGNILGRIVAIARGALRVAGIVCIGGAILGSCSGARPQLVVLDSAFVAIRPELAFELDRKTKPPFGKGRYLEVSLEAGPSALLDAAGSFGLKREKASTKRKALITSPLLAAALLDGEKSLGPLGAIDG